MLYHVLSIRRFKMYNLKNHYHYKVSDIYVNIALVAIMSSFVLSLINYALMTAALLYILSVLVFMWEPLRNTLFMRDVKVPDSSVGYRTLMSIRLFGWSLFLVYLFLPAQLIPIILIALVIILYTSTFDKPIAIRNGWKIF